MRIKPPNRDLGFQTILAISFLLCLNATTLAQEYGFDVWTTENGLPQNTVTGVVQTPDGYLWISTFDGLARFDGVRFTIFDKGNSKGIINNRFAGIYADKEGTVWAFTENGVLTVYRNGVFTSYSTPEGMSESIQYLMADANGKVLIETNERYYYLQEGKFVLAPDQKEKHVRTIYFGQTGAKWVIEPKGISQHKGGQVTFYPLTLDPAYLLLTRNYIHFEDSRGALWGRTAAAGFFRLKDGVTALFTERELPILKEFSHFYFLEDAEGSIWMLFSHIQNVKPNKMVRFKDERFTIVDMDKIPGLAGGLIDREGNFWFATTTGLKRWRRQLITTLSEKDGLNSNEVYPLLQAANGDIFIGSVKGVNLYADGKITSLPIIYPTNVPLYTRGFWEDDKARIWIGYAGGFGRLENGSLRKISTKTIPNGATDFASDRAGNIWIAAGDGLYKYKDDKEIAHYTTNDGLPHNEVITVREDRNGNLWAGTFDGLTQFKDGRFINYGEDVGMPKGFVRVIYEDADGVLWLGTYSDGLVRYKDGKFFNYRVEHGLFSNGVFAILEDTRGNFWMSSNRGIHRVSRQELNDCADGKILSVNAVSYDQTDGMLNVECNGGRLPSAIKAKDGKFWFPTMGGVAIVDPEAEKINPNPPPVVIEDVAVDRKPIETQVFQSAIRNPQSAIELNPGQSNLEINYTGLSLIKSEQIRFKYKLEGLENDWVEAGTKRTVNYSYLRQGEYTFRVIAANANGVWNNEGAVIRIIVHPHFYQTWWFLGLTILTVAGITGLIYHNRVSHLRAIAETKTAFSRQLIESQEAERKRIAAELHDGLGQNLVVIKNRAMLGLNKGDDKERVARELGSISESASQALEEVREITNNLRPQLLDRLGLTKAINAMLKKVSGVIEIESEIDSIDDIFSENEEINVYRIVQESVNNIIKHSNASVAIVTVGRAETKVSITIEDNGKGFDAANVKPTRGGLGLVGLKERAHLLHGEFVVYSKVGEGTKIEVNIPIQKLP